MPRPRTPKGEQSRAAILHAARVLIAERGFAAVTLQMILDAARVTKGKFFHHFKSKEDLFGELLRFVLAERGVLQFSEILTRCSSSDPVAKLFFLIDEIIEWQRKGLPESLRLVVFATFFFSPKSPEVRRISKILSANSAVLQSLVEECQLAGKLSRGYSADTLALLFPSISVGSSIVGFLHGKKQLTPTALLELRKLLAAAAGYKT